MTEFTPRLFVLVLAGLVITGCTVTQQRSEEIDQRILGELEVAAREAPAVEATFDLLLPPPDPLFEEPPEERFHLTVENAPAREFLMSLVAGTDINMVVHPEIRARISLELRNVTIEEVLEIIQELHALEFERTRSGYLVRPARLVHRIYEVSYLDINREGSSRTRVSSGQSTENPMALQDGLIGDTSGTGTLGTTGLSGLGSSNQATGTRIETTSKSNFWEHIEAAIHGILEQRDGRNVMVNPLSGVIAVRAMPNEHRAVAELLTTIEASVQRQVILEAKIVEVELRDGFQSGINWTALADINGRLFGFGQVAGAGLFDEGRTPLRDRAIDVRPGNVFRGFESTAFGGTTVIGADTADFNAFIELLETQGSTRVLSSPRIATINNQKAVIKVGTDEFFVTGVTGRTATGTTSTTAASSLQLTPFFSGIALDVTPQISRGGDIILHVHPTVSEVTDQTKSFTVAGQDESLPLAFSSVRQSDSIIRARNGQLVVIGGLMRESASQQRAGTPILGRVPLFGHAFSSRQERSTKTELVILLRPTVVDDDRAWRTDSARALERTRALTAEPWPH